jgi:endoglucanase
MSPVESHGALSVQGTHIVSSRGTPVVLRGMSLYWSQKQPQFYDHETLAWLRDDWGVSVVRGAIGVQDGGFLENPDEERAKAERIIDAAISLGLYVIIDWHAHNPFPEQAADFFCNLARKYSGYPNLIYEIWNEPSDAYGWAETIKPYHETVCGRIREVDPRNLIVLGTQNWCRDVDVAANAPVAANNVLYALHFYVRTHRQPLREKAERALRMGAPLLVTEWGTGHADGDGEVDRPEVLRWHKFLERHHIGSLNWSISGVAEGSAALRETASRDKEWRIYALTPSGHFVRNMLREYR